jgi:hypothetical protein
MKLKIVHKKYISFFLLLVPLVITFLVSCSKQKTEEFESASKSDSYPEYVEAVAPANHSSINKEPTVPAEWRPENEESATLIKRYPASKEATIPVEHYPEYTKKADSHPEPYPVYVTPEESNPMHTEVALAANEDERSKLNELDDYTVVLAADKHLQIPGLPGELRVWIGNSSFKPDFPSDMEQNETAVPPVGESATVKPRSSAFEIDPSETQCIRIHPRGSEVSFKLTPKKSGTFTVGAQVFLFYSNDCSGAPVPKFSATQKVTVEVNQEEILIEKVKELWNILWEKLLEFWGMLVALILTVILFLIKGKLKQWFGFEKK